jgi:D-alanyl-D-alanine carboxypeptidase
MGMRVCLVRWFAAILLMCTPAIVMAAPGQNTPKASTEAKAVKKAGAKAVKPKQQQQSKYKPRIFSAIVMDASTGQVLSETNADTRGYPASLTKMMTLYMLFDALEHRHTSMSSQIPISARAAAAAPSKLYLAPKQTISVEQAIQALVTKSANDVAVAVGEYLGETEANFAVKMTAKAQAIGMSQTTFKNASGLPNPGQFSTARDMATLSVRLLRDFPQYYGHFSRMEFNYKGQTIRSHNRLLSFYEGADGIKTGYTAASGFNLAASATRNGYRVIGVMFGGDTAANRDKRLANMMDQGFAALSGQPDVLVAGNKDADRIGQQLALNNAPAADETEQGDREEPFQSATTMDRGKIETTSLPPLQETGSEAASYQHVAPQQFAALEPTPAVKTPLPKTSASSWGIQIGAYSQRVAAEKQATTAATKLKRSFGGATAFVMPVTVNGKKVFRARVVGLDNRDLMRACSILGAQAKAGCQAVAPDANRAASR